MAEQLALGKGQLYMYLIPPQLRLSEPAAVCSPAEDRNLQGSHRGVTQVADSVGLSGKAIRIDAVEVVHRQRRQQASPGCCDFVICDLIRCQRRPEIGIVLFAGSLDFDEGW